VVWSFQGRLAVFAGGPDNAVWNIYQSAPGSWSGSGWDSLGGIVTSDPLVTLNQDGCLETFARLSDNALWHSWQLAPNNGWSGWTSIGGGPFLGFT
jgi:hypothetical protein